MEVNLDYVKLNIVIQFKDDTPLPRFPAITFRGGLGHVFRDFFCRKEGEDCPQCPRVNSCVFSYIFKTTVSKAPEIRNNSQLVAPPYIIKVPYTDDRKFYKKRELLELELKIIGKAIDYLPYFVLAFEKLGEKGLGPRRSPYNILHIYHGDKIVYRKGKLKDEVEKNNYYFTTDSIEHQFNDVNRLKLKLKTPLRIEKGGKFITEDFSFELIMRNILRRLDSICYFHMGYKLELDFHNLIMTAKGINKERERLDFYDNIRYSGSSRKIWMGGFTGELAYSGELTPFIPFLELGSIIHIGKKCVFGMGGYRVGQMS